MTKTYSIPTMREVCSARYGLSTLIWFIADIFQDLCQICVINDQRIRVYSAQARPLPLVCDYLSCKYLLAHIGIRKHFKRTTKQMHHHCRPEPCLDGTCRKKDCTPEKAQESSGCGHHDCEIPLDPPVPFVTSLTDMVRLVISPLAETQNADSCNRMTRL
jgi:hypothetical protein